VDVDGVLLVVQPEDHRRIARQLDQDVAEVAEAEAPEQIYLNLEHLGVVRFVEGGRE